MDQEQMYRRGKKGGMKDSSAAGLLGPAEWPHACFSPFKAVQNTGLLLVPQSILYHSDDGVRENSF